MNFSQMGALPRMRTIRQAAAELGLSEYFVRQLVRSNKIVFVRAGQKYFINLDALVSYLNRGDAQ